MIEKSASNKIYFLCEMNTCVYTILCMDNNRYRSTRVKAQGTVLSLSTVFPNSAQTTCKEQLQLMRIVSHYDRGSALLLNSIKY